jgi:uncharacterized integral membrane protein (TIGR00697 family)
MTRGRRTRGGCPAADAGPSVTRSAYPTAVAGFCGLLLISNVAAVKLIDVAGLTFDGGALLFPGTYILGDLLAEVWGFAAARRAILMGLVLSALASATWWAVQAIPPAASWGGQASYESILGFVPRIVAASLAGYLVGQLLNAFVLVRIKAAVRGRALGFRLIASTLVGEAADTVTFCTVAFWGVIAGAQFAVYVVAGYVYKCLAEVVALPATYAAVGAARRHEVRLGLGTS